VNYCDIPFQEKNVRKIVASMLMTLDGVVENPECAVQFRREDSQNYKFDELFASDALLLGRRTYQEFAAGWPSMQGTGKYGERMNSLPKFVVSTTLSEMEWNASLLTGNLAEEVSRIKQQPGQDVLIFGSGELVHSLMSLDLIDEYRLMVFPVVVGSGKRLFREGSEKKVLKLIETRTFSSGVIVLTYRPDRP
jgi:dihydrofolate reductase